MRLFSYIVARDYGFAPNPFYGVCTLATCKPTIRSVASVGDWIIGTGSKKKSLNGRLVYAMKVDEICSFNDYWNDLRFQKKKPVLNGSLKQRYGDNIYHKSKKGLWLQADSHHSLPGGKPNSVNIKTDTGRTDRVLIGFTFGYWGRQGPEIPKKFRGDRFDVCCIKEGHKSMFAPSDVKSFVAWLTSLGLDGHIGTPGEFPI